MTAQRRFWLILSSVLICSVAQATLPGSNPELDRLYEQAKRLLDEAPTADGTDAVPEIVALILERDPEYAAAYVQLARYVLRGSYRGSIGPVDELEPRGRAQAVAMIDHAMELEPTYPDSYIPFAYAALSMGRETLGLLALQRAEELGSKDLLIEIDRAKLLETRREFETAGQTYLSIRERVARGSPDDLSALTGLARLSEDDDAERYLRELVELIPEREWAHGNLAGFLLRQGRFDEAIAFARRALEIRPYRQATSTLALALYCKASDLLLNQGDAAAAASAFAEAQRLYPEERALFASTAHSETFIAVLGLIEQGVDPNARNELGETALVLLIGEEREPDVRALLEHGADVNVRDENGWTALHHAIGLGSSAVVATLLEFGADPNAERADRKRPLDVAAEKGNQEIAALLTAAGAAPSTPPWAAIVAAVDQGQMAGFDRAIKYLQTEGADNIDVLAALQRRLMFDAERMMPLTTQYAGVRAKICGHPARADDSVPSIEARLEVVLPLAQPIDSRQPQQGSEIRDCMYSLRRALGEPAELPIPDQPTADERRALLDRAEALLDSSNGYDQARSRAREITIRLTATGPDDWRAQFLRARAGLAYAATEAVGENVGYYAPDHLDRIAQNLERALRTNPTHLGSLALYAHVLFHEQRPGLARLMFREAERLDPDDPWLVAYQGEFLAGLGDFERAEAMLEHVLASDPDARLRLVVQRYLAQLYAAQGVPELARSAYEALIELDPSRRDSLDNYARYLLFELRDYARAAETARALRNIGALSEDYRFAGDALVAHGAYLLQEGPPFDEAAGRLRYGVHNGTSPAAVLIRALRHPATAISVEALYAAGQSFDIDDADGNPLLFYAVQSADADALAKWISYGADVNALNPQGLSALQLAVELGLDEIARALLAAGARPDTPSSRPGDLRQRAVALGMVGLAELISNVYRARYPDWETFIAGVRSAQPIHIERALTLTADPEAWQALEAAMSRYPHTVVNVADREGLLQAPCGPSPLGDRQSARRSTETRIAEVTRVRDLQVELNVVPHDEALDRCLQLLESSFAE